MEALADLMEQYIKDNRIAEEDLSPAQRFFRDRIQELVNESIEMTKEVLGIEEVDVSIHYRRKGMVGIDYQGTVDSWMLAPFILLNEDVREYRTRNVEKGMMRRGVFSIDGEFAELIMSLEDEERDLMMMALVDREFSTQNHFLFGECSFDDSAQDLVHYSDGKLLRDKVGLESREVEALHQKLESYGWQSVTRKTASFHSITARESEVTDNQARRRQFLVWSVRDELVRLMKPEVGADIDDAIDPEELVRDINKMTGRDLKLSDFNGEVTVRYLDEGDHKWVFVVSFGLQGSDEKVEVVLKKGKQLGDITERELKDLERMTQDQHPFVPRFGRRWRDDKEGKRWYYLEEYMNEEERGDDFWENRLEDPEPVKRKIKPSDDMEFENRAGIVHTVISISHYLGQMPKDLRPSNFVFVGGKRIYQDHRPRDSWVMWDLGERRQPLEKSLLRLIGYYGYYGQHPGSNRFIYEEYLRGFGVKKDGIRSDRAREGNVGGETNGLELLKRNLAHMKEMRELARTSAGGRVQTSLERGKVREERGEPNLTAGDVDGIIEELEGFIRDQEEENDPRVLEAKLEVERIIQDMEKPEVVEMIYQLTGRMVKTVDLSGSIRVDYHREGSHKVVFRVSIGLNNGEPPVLIAFKKAKEEEDIDDEEWKGLGLMSSDRRGITPRYDWRYQWNTLGVSQDREGYFEEFIEGKTVDEVRLATGEVEEGTRDSVVRSLLGVARVLGGEMPKDMHGKNFVVRAEDPKRAVMVDLGNRRQEIGESLLRVISFYGNFGGRRGSNHFIFQAYLDEFDKGEHPAIKKDGLEILRGNLECIKRAQEYERRSGKEPGETSPGKGKIREERGEPTLTSEDIELVIKELEEFIREKDEGRRMNDERRRDGGDFIAPVIVAGLVGVGAYLAHMAIGLMGITAVDVESIRQLMEQAPQAGGLQDIAGMFGAALAGSWVSVEMRHALRHPLSREKREGDEAGEEADVEEFVEEMGSLIERRLQNGRMALAEALSQEIDRTDLESVKYPAKIVINRVDLPLAAQEIKRYLENAKRAEGLEIEVATHELFGGEEGVRGQLIRAGIDLDEITLKVRERELTEDGFDLEEIIEESRGYKLIVIDGVGLWSEGWVGNMVKLVLDTKDLREIKDLIAKIKGRNSREIMQIEEGRFIQNLNHALEKLNSSLHHAHVIEVQA